MSPISLPTADELLLAVLDRAGRIIAFNTGAERLTGWRHEEIEGELVWEHLVAAEFKSRVRGLFETNSDLTVPQEVRWRDRHGGTCHVSCSHTPLRGPGGEVLYVACLGIDVDARKRLDDSIAGEHARLQTILDTAVDGIVTIDEHGIVESVNAAMAHIFGYAESEMIGQNVSMLMPEHYARGHDGYLARYLETGERRIIGVGREVEGRRKDGTVFPLSLAVSEFKVDSTPHFTGILRDVTGRREAEREVRRRLDELAHAWRVLALGEMTTGIAHEVNQPLTAIVSYAQACLRMMASGRADAAVLKDALEQITVQGRRAGDIVQHLRQLARKGEVRREALDLNAAVRGVIELVGHEVASRHVPLHLELAAGLPSVPGNRIQIEQVILNLVRNAVDAMGDTDPDRRDLTIQTRADDDAGVEVSVRDTGHGLGDRSVDSLFDTFYTTKHEGMGVGLSISRSIVESHGGRLWAERNPDRGLSFRFRLPQEETDAV